METVKVGGSLVKDSEGSRLRHKNSLLPIIIVILVLLGSIFGAMGYIVYQLNSEKFFNAHETIGQLSEKYGYVDEYNLTVEERIEADKDGTDGRMNKIYYLDRQELSKEDYVKYTDFRDYYVDIIYTPYTLNLLGSVLTILLLGCLASTLLKSYYKTKET